MDNTNSGKNVAGVRSHEGKIWCSSAWYLWVHSMNFVLLFWGL